MGITPHERQAVEKRIVKLGALIDEMDTKLDASLNPFDAATLVDRASLFKELARLQTLLTDA